MQSNGPCSCPAIFNEFSLFSEVFYNFRSMCHSYKGKGKVKVFFYYSQWSVKFYSSEEKCKGTYSPTNGPILAVIALT